MIIHSSFRDGKSFRIRTVYRNCVFRRITPENTTLFEDLPDNVLDVVSESVYIADAEEDSDDGNALSIRLFINVFVDYTHFPRAGDRAALSNEPKFCLAPVGLSLLLCTLALLLTALAACLLYISKVC